jgi:hypothetical protein
MIADWFSNTIKPAITPAVWIWLAIMFAALSAGATWWLMRPGAAPEQPALEQRQADGSLILQRQATTPTVRPKQRIPPAAKLERVAQVIVQPDAPAPEAGQPCPPVTVDLTLIREQDGGRRILASSPDGVVVGGIDVPVEPIVMPAPAKRWAAGLSWSPIDRTSGIWIERDLMIPLVNLAVRVGVDLNQAVHTSASGLDPRMRIGIAF